MRVHPPEKRAQMALEDAAYTWRDMAVKVEGEVQMGKIHRGFEVCVCPKPMFSLNEQEEMINDVLDVVEANYKIREIENTIW